MTHPGVGALTALAYVLIIGTPSRFQRGKQIGTYVGMIPSEDSSAGQQRLGHIRQARQFLVAILAGGRQPRRQHGSVRSGDVATFTWRCVDTGTLPG